MNICIFEDNAFSHFYPLSLTRPVYQLRTGIFTLEEKIRKLTPGSRVFYHSRKYLNPVLKQQKRTLLSKNNLPSACLFINGRVIADKKFIKKTTATRSDTIYYYKKQIVAAYLTRDIKNKITLSETVDFDTKGVIRKKIECTVADYIWDLVHHNAKEIVKDASQGYSLGDINGYVYERVSILNKKNVYISRGAVIKPCTVIDAEKGPVIIDRGAIVHPNCTIIGPVYVGPRAVINPNSKILPATTIGESCKVGGEISESILHGYSNKQHEGFLGNSYVGSWCNLGAGTSNSDLKNNYSTVEVTIDNKKVNTGQQFVGFFMGDHSKTAINTMINTGTVIGTACNLFGAGFPPKYIPSFSWINISTDARTYDIKKFFSTAKVVCKRRSVIFSAADQKIYSKIFSLTASDRK